MFSSGSNERQNLKTKWMLTFRRSVQCKGAAQRAEKAARQKKQDSKRRDQSKGEDKKSDQEVKTVAKECVKSRKQKI